MQLNATRYGMFFTLIKTILIASFKATLTVINDSAINWGGFEWGIQINNLTRQLFQSGITYRNEKHPRELLFLKYFNIVMSSIFDETIMYMAFSSRQLVTKLTDRLVRPAPFSTNRWRWPMTLPTIIAILPSVITPWYVLDGEFRSWHFVSL